MVVKLYKNQSNQLTISEPVFNNSEANYTTVSTPASDTLTSEANDSLWEVIVWDDPINLMDYVVYVFKKLFGFSEMRATELMMQVHTEGKAIVLSTTQEIAETAVKDLHIAGLMATLQH